MLFLIYDLDRGGPELRLLDFAKYFPENVNMYICVTSEKLTLLEKFRDLNIRTKVVPIKKPYFSLLKILKIFSFYKTNNIRIINTYDLKGLIIASIIKLTTFFQSKIIYHNVNSLIQFSRIQLLLFCLISKLSDAFICNSKFSKNEIEKLVPSNKIRIIHNGLDQFLYKKNSLLRKHSRANLNIQKDEVVIGIIANFRKQKNYPFLLEAFKILAAKYSHLQLLCVGGGEYLKRSKSIVKSWNLNKKVIFTGYTENIVECLSAIDILVLPSLWEGLPNALLQGMSMEIPVVASNVGGCPEIIHHMKNGRLFRSNDTLAFITHLEELINDRALAYELGRRARKTVEEKFSMERMIKEYLAFFKQISES
jgi:L-malate glycosyltransferase